MTENLVTSFRIIVDNIIGWKKKIVLKTGRNEKKNSYREIQTEVISRKV